MKLPRTITHDPKLRGTRGLIETFLAEASPLASRLGCLLAQLPPSLAYDARVARPFFALLRARFEGAIAVEPRHESWFTAGAERMLAGLQVARVVVDPLRAAEGAERGGWAGLA